MMATATADVVLRKGFRKRKALPVFNTQNTTMLRAMKETDAILAHPERYKSYDSVDELFRDLDA